MTSERKIAANRQNARRSTGPRTDRGKARARRNALEKAGIKFLAQDDTGGIGVRLKR